MSVERIKRGTVLEPGAWQGLTADDRPTPTDGVEVGESYWELDGKKAWIYSEKNTNPSTSDGWWPV